MERYGVKDNDGVSPFLKVSVCTADGALFVCGYIGDGANWGMQQNWESPFENNHLGSMAGMATNAMQTGVAAGMADQIKSTLGLSDDSVIGSMVGKISDMGQGMTTISTMNSLMSWNGGRPPSISLPIHFLAREDAATEVQGALLALNQMISPELGAMAPGGRAPRKVIVNIGRTVALTDCVIQSMNMELDAPRGPDGCFMQNTVTLDISGSALLNGTDMPNVIMGGGFF